MVIDNTIDYAFKYADRNKLVQLTKQRGQCDDILIIRNGLVTDTSYANTIFLKDCIWYSQQKPLLMGTRLSSYLAEGRVTPLLLTPGDLHLFTQAKIINAMISIEASPVIPVDAIHF